MFDVETRKWRLASCDITHQVTLTRKSQGDSRSYLARVLNRDDVASFMEISHMSESEMDEYCEGLANG